MDPCNLGSDAPYDRTVTYGTVDVTPEDALNGNEEMTERRQAVLDVVLALLVEKGAAALTMTSVAQRARCSKETLYKWFGDRDGLLTETVRWQASKVRAGAYDRQHLDAGALRESLEAFAANWLRVISSGTSVALNRVAIGQAETLGPLVLANGRFAIGERLKPLLSDARAAGLVAFEDAEEAFRTFFGLVGRDVQIRLLLGDRFAVSEAVVAQDAARAAKQFLALYGAAKPPADAGRNQT